MSYIILVIQGICSYLRWPIAVFDPFKEVSTPWRRPGQVCWNAFKHFDRNDNGSISHSELERLLEQEAIKEIR